MYTLRTPAEDELELLVDFILPFQAEPRTRCLHLDWTPEGLRTDLQDLDQPLTEAFRLAFDGDRLVGLLGVDLDPGAGRAWLHGPFAREADWEAIVTALFDELWSRLPESITRVSNYLELAYAPGLAFHARFGFVQKSVSHIYRAARRPLGPVDGVTAMVPGEICQADAEAVRALHDAAFTQSWLNGRDMIAAIDAQRAVLIAHAHGRLAGYIRLKRHAVLSEGTVDYLAVDPALRGQGFGRRLLEAGLHWIFVQQGLETAFLNVSADNANARGLYERAGFSLYQSGAALDWWRTADAEPGSELEGAGVEAELV